MGKLFDRFNCLKFSNEAEVSQNFIIPLLVEFLGYSNTEIVPEKNYPAKDLYSGVNFAGGGSKGLKHRPDYVVCINGDTDNVKFIIDSKGPDENLNDHIGQLKSYANSVGQNFLMITNGIELLVFDVNEPIFKSSSIEELQSKFHHLNTILGRNNQLTKTAIEIIKELNIGIAISYGNCETEDEQIRKRKMELVDFNEYLNNIEINFTAWHLPVANFKGISNLNIKKIDPNHLLTFKLYHFDSFQTLADEQTYKFSQVQSTFNSSIKIFVGETGTGKTSLLKFLTLQNAQNALAYIESKIPIFISLKEIGVNYTLESLITASLNRYGYRIKNYEELLHFRSFTFHLDAFDEVNEAFRGNLIYAIEHLSSHFECYITSRPNAIPKINNALVFNIQPLSETQVEEISRDYLNSKYYDFQQQLELNDLLTESRNILLLLFMISLYREENQLPNTASKVIKAIVNRIKLWQENRTAAKSLLKWVHVSRILSEIAIRIFQDDTMSIKRSTAETLIADCIRELNEEKQISNNTTIDDIIIALSETGLIIAAEDHMYFWHRLFLNHFAAKGLEKQFKADATIIEALSDDERWDIIIIAMASDLEDCTELIEQLLKRLWLSAYCLIENPTCTPEQTEKIVSELCLHISSVLPDNRSKAVYFLERINNPQAQNALIQSVQNTTYDDVRMLCLSAISINSNKEAKKIIDKYLDWNIYSAFSWWSSQRFIIQALSYYGEEGYHQIITNWEKYSNYDISESCKKVFQRLFSTNKLSAEMIFRLQNLYLVELNPKNPNAEKIESIADILVLVPQLDFCEKIISLIPTVPFEYSKQNSMVKILRSVPSIDLVHKILSIIKNGSFDQYLTGALARALKESVAAIPKELFYQLIEHPSIQVAGYGLEALKRFPFSEIKSEIEKHLRGTQQQLQCRALEIIIDKGQFINLIRQQQFPDRFYNPTAHVLLEAVRRFHFMEAMPLLDSIRDSIINHRNYSNDFVIALDLACTFKFLGENEKQHELISLYFDGETFLFTEDYILPNLMRSIKHLDRELALKIAAAYFKNHLSPLNNNQYATDIFIVAAEELGGEWMRERIKEIADRYLNNLKIGGNIVTNSLERPLRALIKIGCSKDEMWLHSLLPYLSKDSGLHYNQLRRAIECMSMFGTTDSLSIILEISDALKDVESVLDVCQIAYNSICRREKIPVRVTKDLIG